MAKVPSVRDVAWLAVIPQLAILTTFIVIATVVRGRYDNPALMLGAGAYLVLSFALRHTLTRQHRIERTLLRAASGDR